MKKKLLIVPLISLFFFIPLNNVAAFDHIDNINDGISVYFLAYFNSSEYLEVNVTHLGEGNFSLFLFDARPVESFIRADKSLDYRIYDVAINYSLNDNPYIFHNITESRIYYVQLILLENGPDTFFLYCNKELTRYYLPIIPGYTIGILVLSMILAFAFITMVRKRKIVLFQG